MNITHYKIRDCGRKLSQSTMQKQSQTNPNAVGHGLCHKANLFSAQSKDFKRQAGKLYVNAVGFAKDE
jgi:hypothetical protein